jgi:hypothetical protein
MNFSEIETTSHSRLGVFEKCGKMYEYQYIKNEAVHESADHFIIGEICHGTLEDYYNNVYATVEESLAQQWQGWLAKHNLLPLLDDLRSYSGDISHLYHRASPLYMGKDKIRKRDGSVADNPQMTTDWKRSVEDLQLDQRSHNIDLAAVTSLGPGYTSVSLSNCYSETIEIMRDYRDPAQLKSIDWLEFPISHRVRENGEIKDFWNPVQLPTTGVYLNGYIDLVGRMKDQYGGGVVLLDHKTTSGGAPNDLEIMHHEQLLKYAWAWHQLTGEWPTHIGVNHLRSKSSVIVELDPNEAIAAIERTEALIQAQKTGQYIRKDPFAYGSPCVRMRDHQIEKHCPYLAKCHPSLGKKLGLIP